MESNDQAVTQSPEDRIMALLDKEMPEETQEEVTPETQEQETTAEAQPETEANTVEIDPDAKFIEVEVTVEGGEKRTEKLSLNELKAQRMMQADYQRKTQELARQRDEVPEKIRQGIQEQLTKSVQEIQSLQEMLLGTVAPELRSIDWNKLATEDPAQYVQMSNRARQVETAWKQMEAAKQAKLQELSAQQQASMQKLREEAKARIQAEIPHWNDDLDKSLRETGIKAYGFTQEQLDSITHPGFTKLLHDAHEYQKSKSAKETVVDKKVAIVPKVLKPGTVKQGDGTRERVTESIKKLQKTHSVDDAAAAIFHMLK